MSWTPIYSFAVIAVIFVVSEYCAKKTKGYVSFLVFACIFFAAGFWSGLLPADIFVDTGITGIVDSIAMPLIIVNMGAGISVSTMLSEWKSVVISLLGIIGVIALCITAGFALWGQEYALAAMGPIAGGLVAAKMVQDAALAAGNDYIGAFAMVLIAIQNMIGMPIASYCIKRDIGNKLRTGSLSENEAKRYWHKCLRLFPSVPSKHMTPQVSFAKTALVASLGMFIGTLSPIPAPVMYLILGCLARGINFLPEQPLGKAGGYGFFMFCMMTRAPESFASLSPAKFFDMVEPILGLMALGIIGIAVFSVVAGKVLRYSPSISFAVGMTALLGYPNTQIITEEAIASMDCSSEEKEKALKYALPKMLVGGFTTVSVASVILTSIIAPLIFS